MTIGLSFKFHKKPSCLKASRTLLKKEDTLLEYRRILMFLTVAEVIDQFSNALL